MRKGEEQVLEQGEGVRPAAEEAAWDGERVQKKIKNSQPERNRAKGGCGWESERRDSWREQTDGEQKYERYSRTTSDKLLVIYKMITTNECNFSLANEIAFWAGSKPLRSDFILTVIKWKWEWRVPCTPKNQHGLCSFPFYHRVNVYTYIICCRICSQRSSVL